jgi:hypothetical protein
LNLALLALRAEVNSQVLARLFSRALLTTDYQLPPATD